MAFQPVFLRDLPRIALLVSLTSSVLACGDDSGGKDKLDPMDSGVDDDAGALPRWDGSFPDARVSWDASDIIEGDPPPELEDEACAVDTNKLYELTESALPPAPTQVAVDQIGSQFGVAYLDRSDQCFDVVKIVMIEGPSDLILPEPVVAVEPCAPITRTALTRTLQAWLVATEDGREGARDIWVQGYDGKNMLAPHNITGSLAEKSELAIAALNLDENPPKEAVNRALVAWVEQGFDAMGSPVNSLHVRAISPLGEPIADEVVLEEMGAWSITGLSVAPIGQFYFGVAYRRFDQVGASEIVFDVLDAATGARDRPSWILSTQAGTRGSVDLSTDSQGGGVIYSIDASGTHQLWFQELSRDGFAAKVMSGMLEGGPAPPTRVVGTPYNAVDASLAKLPVGFGIAYRSLPGGGVAEPVIHIEFVDKNGRSIGGGSDIAFSGEFGGRTAMEGAYDGRVVLSWSDTATEGDLTKLFAVKLPCIGGG